MKKFVIISVVCIASILSAANSDIYNFDNSKYIDDLKAKEKSFVKSDKKDVIDCITKAKEISVIKNCRK